MGKDLRMKPFIVMDIVKKAQSLKDVIHLEIGEPDFLPSPKVQEALKDAINKHQFFYTESKGLLALRKKIAAHYQKVYNLTINPDNIIITTGTSTAFLIAFYFAKTIATQSPGYPCYKNFAILEQKKFIPIPTDFPEYQLKVEELKKFEFDTLLISNPNNPTGTIHYNLDELCTFCQKEKKLLISDELYHGLIYDASIKSALSFNKDAIVISGFSKYFAMPGLRIGWMIVPDKLKRQAEIIAQNILISAPTLSQFAAIKAFDYSYLNQIQKSFKERKIFATAKLAPYFPIANSKGAFYLWLDISQYSNDALNFCNELLEQKKVALTPGIDFGVYPNFVRLAYTKDIKTLEEGINRIIEFIQ